VLERGGKRGGVERAPVDADSFAQQRFLLLHFVEFEVAKGGDAHHVHKDALLVEHEIGRRRTEKNEKTEKKTDIQPI